VSISLSTTWHSSIKLLRLIERHLQAVQCEVILDLDFDPKNDMQQQQHHLLMMRTWLDDVLDGSIAFSVLSDLDTTLLGEISNNIMFCPDEPHDHLLLALVISKLNAIGGGHVMIRSGTIVADASGGFSTTLSGNTNDLLPDAEDWMGAVRYWDQPWWNRPDGGMIDLPVNEGDDPADKPDILIDLCDGDARPVIAATEPENSDPSEIKTAEIIRPDFRRKTRDD
jgi:hypothetical protein